GRPGSCTCFMAHRLVGVPHSALAYTLGQSEDTSGLSRDGNPAAVAQARKPDQRGKPQRPGVRHATFAAALMAIAAEAATAESPAVVRFRSAPAARRPAGAGGSGTRSGRR